MSSLRLFCLTGVVLASAVLSAQVPVSTPAGAPPAPPPSGLIVGRAIDALTNRPLANVIVAITGGAAVPREMTVIGAQAGPPRRVVTNDDGRFVFVALSDGLYTINATAPGYLPAAYGQQRPQSAAQQIALGRGQPLGDVTVRLWKECTIAGTITDEAGDPVVDATVSVLRRSETTGRWPTTTYASSRTDDRGAYRISGLQPGRFFVVVSASVTSVPASIAPLAQAQAQMAASASEMSELQMTGLRGPNAGLQVGDNLVQLSASNSMSLPPIAAANGTLVGYRTTFFPGATTSVRATPVFLSPGEERAGVDIQMRPLAMTQVSGTLFGPDGPAGNFTVRLVPTEVDAVGGSEGPFDVAVATTNASGQFMFAGVPPGAFVLRASRQNQDPNFQIAARPGQPSPPEPRPALWAEMPVAVGDQPVMGVNLTLRPTPAIRGRIEFEGTAPRPSTSNLAGLSVLTPADGRPVPCCVQAQVDASGGFTIPSFYFPGKYFVTLTTLQGWNLKSATAGGRDVVRGSFVIDSEGAKDIVITMVDKVSEIRGRVVGANGRNDVATSVLMFPADLESWIKDGVNTRVVRLARPTPQNGAYSFLNVVPGDYMIIAAPDEQLPLWQDPAVIEAAARAAMPITVGVGEKKSLDLTVRSFQ